jgi:hypothetical protein
MIVAAQRATVHTAMNAVPATGTWPSIAEPSGAPKTISAVAIPPSAKVANISRNAIRRFPANLRSFGTS